MDQISVRYRVSCAISSVVSHSVPTDQNRRRARSVAGWLLPSPPLLRCPDLAAGPAIIAALVLS
jgi:hypothetical protein